MNKYIIVNEPHWEDVLEIGKKYYIYYDDDNTPFIFDECNEQRFDIFHFDDDFEFFKLTFEKLYGEVYYDK